MTGPNPGSAPVKVSVAMVTYNHEGFIGQAIESILMQQTDFAYEVVIGEDCSTDGTREGVAEFAQRYPERIRPLFHEHNLGLHGQNNFVATLNACSGEYVAILEGDDYWKDPTKLQKQVDFLDANPDYVLCYHDEIEVDEHGAETAKSRLLEGWKTDRSRDELIKSAVIPTLTSCFRNVLGELPPEFTKVFNGDTFLFSLLGNFGCAKYMGSEITPAAYRRHGGGIWSSMSHYEARSRLANTHYWLSRYYGRIGKSVYSRHFANEHQSSLLQVLKSDDAKHTLLACKGFLSRRENLLDSRFVFHFTARLVRALWRSACLNMRGTAAAGWVGRVKGRNAGGAEPPVLQRRNARAEIHK